MATVFSRTSRLVFRSSSSVCSFSIPLWKRSVKCDAFKTGNLGCLLTRFGVHCYSTRKPSENKPIWKKKKKKVYSKPKPVIKDENPFYIVRKGDLVGVYTSLNDCQAQVGNSICDPPVSVYKGHSMPKETRVYLLSRGLKNALYSIRAAELTMERFGTLSSIPLQEVESTYLANVSLKQVNLDHLLETEDSLSGPSCTLEFDGASKGNPGQAGAGVVLRGDDGTVYRLREGLGKATNNVAEYRAFILGLRFALEKGYTSIRVIGDSKLVCMQMQGLWRVKTKHIHRLYQEAKKLKDNFLSFQITHVERGLNSDADAQANFAVMLADGQVQEEVENSSTKKEIINGR